MKNRILIFVLLAISVLSLIYAFTQKLEAERQAAIAYENEKTADAHRKIAEELRARADEMQALAEARRAEAMEKLMECMERSKK